ncbi:MAG TPA: DUF4870 domain-containing protein [Bryobacteraceae bacterium]|jgi:uncharacterized membrane protein|nr:DUF4870 domain-containing protein [Bryobacteraceae bacterium]
MAFCPNCGTQATGAFCPNCGAALGGATANPNPNPNATAGGYVPPAAASAPGLETNVASALCYLFGLVTGIIFLLIAPYNQNKTVRFHAFQSIFLHIGLIIIGIILSMFGIMTHGLGLILFPIFWICVLILWLYMMWSAYSNKMVKLPVIGDLAQKQA